MAIYEQCFSVDEFKNPKVYKNGKAVGTLLTRLLLLEPGTFQSHPEMGVGLVSRYRYCTEDQLHELRSDFQQQIEKYLPQFQSVQIKTELKNKILIISTELDGYLFAALYNTETSEYNDSYVKLSNL